MRVVDYTEKIKEFKFRMSKVQEDEILEYDRAYTQTGKFVAVVQLPNELNAVDVVDNYLEYGARVCIDDAPAEDLVCEFIYTCGTILGTELDCAVLEPEAGVSDLSFLNNELDGLDISRLVVLTLDDFDYGRQAIVVPVEVLVDAMNDNLLDKFVELHAEEENTTNIKIDLANQSIQFFDTYEEMVDGIEAHELDPNDSSVRIIRTIEPEESLEEYLESSKVWLDKIADDRQQLRDAHANIIVTLRDAYLQTFEQIAKLLNDYYGVVRTRQSIHSLYERVKKRESSIIDYETQREILIMRILGMSISKIHNKFTQLTEYGINEIIKVNQRELDELKIDLIDHIAKKLAMYTANVGEYKACGEYEAYERIDQQKAIKSIKETLGVPVDDIRDKEFNNLLQLAIERLATDRIAVLASVIYGSQKPSLKSAKSFMLSHGVPDKWITAKSLKELW